MLVAVKLLISIVLLHIAGSLTCGQQFSTSQTEKALSMLNEQEKVDYINENFYAIYSADYQKAKKLTYWAAETANANSWKTREGYALMNYGVVTYLKGEYDIALPAYLQSLYLFDSLGHDAGKAMLYAEMANYYQKIGHGEKKFSLLDSAKAYSIKIGDKRGLAKTYGMRAAFLKKDGLIDEAKEYYDKNFQINLKLKDSIGLGYIYLDKAFYAQREGDFQKSLTFVNQSIRIRKAIHDKQGIAESLDFLGDTYHRESKYREAIANYQRCVEYSKNVQYPDQARIAYAQMVECYKAMGAFEQAFYYQDSAYTLKDSLFNIARAQAIEEFQTKYETSEKEKQLAIQESQLSEQEAVIAKNNLLLIALLIVLVALVVITLLARSRIRRKQELMLQQKELDYRESQLTAVISSQEKERKRFASDLHDGFGQLISVLKMNVDAIRNQNGDIEKKNELFEKSTEILNGMYDELRGICFNLMPHTLVQQGLVPALKEFADRVNLSGKVTIEVMAFGFEQRVSDLQEISLYRVVQEWVNNTLKYGDATSITIQLTKDTHELTLTIEDNGQGFDKDDLIHSKGNGWKNINSRANLIKAEIDIDTSPSQRGSMFTMNVPMLTDSQLVDSAQSMLQ